MSKSILVFDTPEECVYCPCFMENARECWCVATRETIWSKKIGEISRGFKSGKCTLKPMPERKYIVQGMKGYTRMVHECKGWNDCIDELLGEENNDR